MCVLQYNCSNNIPENQLWLSIIWHGRQIQALQQMFYGGFYETFQSRYIPEHI